MLPLSDENPNFRVPIVTTFLIVVNVIVFLYQVILGQENFIIEFALIPAELLYNANLSYSEVIPPKLSILTSMFLHGSFLHLLSNMWFLWIFGDNIEDFLGHFTFFIFYLLGGVGAALVHVILNSDSIIPTIGASGAISAVLGAYFILYPSIRIKTLILFGFFIEIIRVPAVFFLGLWFIMQFFGTLSGEAQGIAFGAHIGGFLSGLLFILLFTKRTPFVRMSRYEPRRIKRW